MQNYVPILFFKKRFYLTETEIVTEIVRENMESMRGEEREKQTLH